MTGIIQAARLIGHKVDKIQTLLTLINKELETTSHWANKTEYRKVINAVQKNTMGINHYQGDPGSYPDSLACVLVIFYRCNKIVDEMS